MVVLEGVGGPRLPGLAVLQDPQPADVLLLALLVTFECDHKVAQLLQRGRPTEIRERHPAALVVRLADLRAFQVDDGMHHHLGLLDERPESGHEDIDALRLTLIHLPGGSRDHDADVVEENHVALESLPHVTHFANQSVRVGGSEMIVDLVATGLQDLGV